MGLSQQHIDARIIELESFWRTIVGDYFELRTDAFDWVKDLNVALLGRPEHVREQVMAHVEKRDHPFCQTFNPGQEASMHRRFFISNNKYMGLAPAEILIGDLICILFGTNMPAIL